MTLQSGTDRFFITNTAGRVNFDTNRPHFVFTNAVTGRISLPAEGNLPSVAIVQDVTTDFGAIHASATKVFGVCNVSSFGTTTARPIGGTVIVNWARLPMNNDPLSNDYRTKQFGPNVLAAIRTLDFTASGGRLTVRRKTFYPDTRAYYDSQPFGATTVDFLALCFIA